MQGEDAAESSVGVNTGSGHDAGLPGDECCGIERPHGDRTGNGTSGDGAVGNGKLCILASEGNREDNPLAAPRGRGRRRRSGRGPPVAQTPAQAMSQGF